MKSLSWSPEKNQQLIKDRGISFEDVVYLLGHGGLLEDIKHPNDQKYPNQRMFIVQLDDYAYLVPYVETSDEIFLKTIIPSRKATKHYLGANA